MTMKHEISREDFYTFIFRLGLFSAFDVDPKAFVILNQICCALLDESGLLEEYLEFHRNIKIPRNDFCPAGQC